MASWMEKLYGSSEVFHTTALEHLLEDADRGPLVASRLAGEEVQSVSGISREKRLAGCDGKADLVAELHLADGGELEWAVETKLDSQIGWEQLERTVVGDQRGLVFAPGITAFNMTEDDLRRWESVTWTAAGPSEWAECLVAVDAGSINPMFSDYISQVQREALEHEEALALAHEANAESWLIERSRRGDGALEHYAWMSALRTELPEKMDWAWEPKAERSGPLMIYWEDDGYGLRERGAGRETFLQIDCNWQSRRLRFKLGANIKGNHIPLTLAYEKALAVLHTDNGTWIAAPPPMPHSKTCTVAWVDLSAYDAATAAYKVYELTEQAAGRS
jgi:hypothetical protein